MSPWKGVIRLDKKGKLSPKYVGPFEIIERTCSVAYRLGIPQKLSSVHDTFHVSSLKKCLADTALYGPGSRGTKTKQNSDRQGSMKL